MDANLSCGSSRTVRVFISSTFQDMQQERDELAQRIFPELRARLWKHGINIIEIDLRWGITEKQERSGEVLPTCLRQIDQSRPFFIGLLGERYGSIQPFVDQQLLQHHPWLKFHDKRSLTELEFLHGALLNSAAAEHALFYFRSPEYIKNIPIDQQHRYIEKNPRHAERLRMLKTRVLDEGFPVVDGYVDPVSLGDQVLFDLWAALEHTYPELQSNAEDCMDVSQFAQGAASDEIETFVGRNELSLLDEHVDLCGGGIGIVGRPGLGKTNLLKAWVRNFAKTHPEYFIFEHYMGALSQGSDQNALLKRLFIQIRHDTMPDLEFPKSALEQRQIIGKVLERVAEMAPVVLVIDGLDQIKDDGGAIDLGFLPDRLPKRVSAVFSMRPGRAVEAIQRRGWNTFELGPLSVSQRGEIILRYLDYYGKQLSPDRSRLLADCELMESPLILRSVLEELRVGARHENLDTRIHRFIKVNSGAELFNVFLGYFQERLSKICPGILEDTMSLLWASRSGLLEKEIFELLGTDQKPMVQKAWSILLSSFKESLRFQAGRIRFRHDYISQAVELRYLKSPEARNAARKRLVAYFQKQELGQRKLTELPWQLITANSFKELKDLLIRPEVFQKMLSELRHDLAVYWRQLEEHYDIVEEMNNLQMNFEAQEPIIKFQADHAEIIAEFLESIGKPTSAVLFFERALSHLKASLGWNSERVGECLRLMGHAQFQAQDYMSAVKSLRRSLAIYHKTYGVEHKGVADALAGLAGALSEMKDPIAEKLFRKALAISLKVRGRSHHQTAILLDNMGYCLDGIKNENNPIALQREALAICESTFGPDHRDTAICLDNLAMRLIDHAEYEEAELLSRRSLSIWKRECGEAHPDTQIAFSHLGFALLGQNNISAAAEVYRSKLKAWKVLEDFQRKHTLDTLLMLASELKYAGRNREAELVLQDYLDTLEANSGVPDPAVLNRLARVLYEQGAIQESERLFERASMMVVSEKSGDKSERAHALMGLGMVARDRGESQQAIDYLQEALDLSVETDAFPMQRAECLNLLATVALIENDIGAADNYSQQAVTVALQAYGKDTPQVASLFDLRSRVLIKMGDYIAAERLNRQAFDIFEKELYQDHPNLLSVLHNFAVIQAGKGDFEEAETMFRRVAQARERILGLHHPNTANTLWQLADTLFSKGAYEEALAVTDQAMGSVSVAPDVKSIEVAERILLRARCFSELGRHHEAEKVCREALARCIDSQEQALPVIHHYKTAIGESLEARGEFEKAEQFYRDDLADIEERGQTITINIRFERIGDLVRVLIKKGNLEAAENLIRKAIDIASSRENIDPAWCAIWQSELANVLSSKGKYDLANELYGLSYAFFREKYGDEHEVTVNLCQRMEINSQRQAAGPSAKISSILDRAETCLRGKDIDGAEELLQQALSLGKKSLKSDDPLIGRALSVLGAVHFLRGDFDEAEKIYRHSLEICEEKKEGIDLNTIISYKNLAGTLESKGEYEKATQLYRIVVDKASHIKMLNDEDMIRTGATFARCLINVGKEEEAAILLVRFVDANIDKLQSGSPESVKFFYTFVIELKDQFSDRVLEPFLSRLLELVPRASGVWPTMGAHASYMLARLYSESGRHSDAVLHYEGVLEGVELLLRPEHLNSDRELPEQALLWAAVALVELARHRDRPLKKWDGALAHLDLAISLFKRVKRSIAALRIELERQDLRREANLAVDVECVRKISCELAENNNLNVEEAMIINRMVVWLHNLDKLDDAKELAFTLLNLDEKFYSEAYSFVTIHLNILSEIFLIQGKLEEAVKYNLRAWQLNRNRHDYISARILLIRIALAIRLEKEIGIYVGQIKVLMEIKSSMNEDDSDTQLRKNQAIDHLQRIIRGERVAFLVSLASAIGDARRIPELSALSLWDDQSPVPLNTKWPSLFQ